MNSGLIPIHLENIAASIRKVQLKSETVPKAVVSAGWLRQKQERYVSVLDH